MTKSDLIERANARYRKSVEFWHNWRSVARDDFAFVSGDQWLDADASKLRAEDRVAITFNYSEKMIDAVIGAEVSNRQEVRYNPRDPSDSGLADIWNAASKYVRDNCNAEDEESDAFRDAMICGMGWTWTRMDYTENPDGDIIIERIDPFEMFPDPAATKPSLADRRWNDRLWWVDMDDAKSQWPKATFAQANSENDTSKGVITRGHRYADDGSDSEAERHSNQVQIRLHEWYELEPIIAIAAGSRVLEVSEDDFKQLQAQFPEIKSVKRRKKVYYRAFFAGETCIQGPEPSPCQEGFTFNCITGKRDRNRNEWYGLTRVMKDPQRWANKWLSQILHIVNSNAKGGLMAEIGAFVDPVRAQEEWSKPDSITLFNEGALSGKKAQQKQPAPYPAGLDKLMGFALESLPMVTGINLEALGLANREQAGVLEQQRKQAAYGLLAPLFDSLRRYRKTQGHVLLYFINNFISDGRLIRIGGPESQQFLPLTKQPDAARYDIVVDQSPNAPDVKQATWEALVEIIPAMLKAGVPIPPDVLDYTPLPTSLAMKWKQFIGQQQQVSQEMQQQMQQLQQENDALKSDQQVKMQEIGLKRYEMEQQLQMEQEAAAQKIQMEREAHRQRMQLEREKAQSQFELESFKQDRQFELEARRQQHESTMKSQQLDNDFKVKAFSAGMQPDDAGKFSIDINAGDIAQQISQFAQASSVLADQAQQSNNATLAAIQRLIEALSRPRALTFDQSGRPVGSSLQ